jgi:hypothetical protein
VLSGGYQLWQEFSCAVDAWATVPSGGYQLWQEFSCAVDAGATVPSGVYQLCLGLFDVWEVPHLERVHDHGYFDACYVCHMLEDPDTSVPRPSHGSQDETES